MFHEFRIYMTAPFYDPAPWFNSLVFETVMPAESNASRALCMQLLNSWKSLHLPYVQFNHVAVFEHNHVLQERSDSSPFVFHAQRQFQGVPRPFRTPAPPWVGLQLNKTTALGRGGKQWLFHCLNDDEIEDGAGGMPVLKDTQGWEGLVEFWLRGALIGFPYHQLVVPPRLYSLAPANIYKPAEFRLGHPFKARARVRSRAAVPPPRWTRQGTAAYIGQTADKLQEDFEYQIATGTDFLDAGMQGRLLQMVSYVADFTGELLKLPEGEQIDDSNDLYMPLSRWGATVPEMARYAGRIFILFQDTISTIQQIKTYTYAGDEYLKLKDAKDLQIICDEWANYAAGIMNCDYPTPYSIKLDGTDIDAP